MSENPTACLPLNGTAALITGGGSGIGLAAAAALVADGADVTLMGRTAAKLEAAAVVLRANAPEGVRVSAYAGDVTADADVAAAVGLADAEGQLRIAVASAGDGTMGPVVATSTDEWNRVIGVSLTGVFLTFREAGAAIVRNGGGSMVAVSSVASRLTHRFMAPYSVAKAGVDMLVKVTADELGQAGVRVNAVNPGIIRTELVAMIEEDSSVGQSYLTNTPLGRFGEVDDVAPLIRFLCGPESGFITGETVGADG
ncbi:MAG TPA: short-chain dehydrogenase, partial [Candidatus Microthrix parvicella]|nr:short-chain dehydrogenase [Candidatus Microthrix parvicella]